MWGSDRKVMLAARAKTQLLSFLQCAITIAYEPVGAEAIPMRINRN